MQSRPSAPHKALPQLHFGQATGRLPPTSARWVHSNEHTRVHSRERRGASVLSGCSATSSLTRSVCGSSEKVLYPPNLSGLTLPVSRLRLMNPPTVLQSHVEQLSNFLTGMTRLDCRNDTFAQIVAIGLPHS